MKLASLPRVWRTLRALRAEQAWAQLAYATRGLGPPVRLQGAAPGLQIEQATVPFLPAPAHARMTGERLELLNVEIDLGDPPDWDFEGAGPLWSYHLHQFDWLRQPELSAERRTTLLLDWVQRHREGVGWNPHPISLRILSWGKLLLTHGALRQDAGVVDVLASSLADQAETLARRPEKRLQANHLLSNRLGVVFAGLLLRGEWADRWLASAPVFCQELARQIDRDGAHVERSPMYHALLLENLLDLLNLARCVPDRASAVLVRDLEDCTSRMLGALRVCTHPDGNIALFGDSAFGIAQLPSTLNAYASALGVVPEAPRQQGVLKDAGFVRLVQDPFTLLASWGGPMPVYQPGHAHCDSLSFELSVGEERVVTDTGVAEYIPGALRDLSRATRSHATLEVEGYEQAEVWSAHRVGGRPTVRLLDAEPPHRIEASCAGWRTHSSPHRRSFTLSPGVVEIQDWIEGAPRPVRATLPLAPGLHPELTKATDGRARVRIQLRSGVRLEIALPSGLAWALERSVYMPEFGRSEERTSVVGSAASFTTGVWRIEIDGTG